MAVNAVLSFSYNSLKSIEVSKYLQKKGQKQIEPTMSVIVQEMIQPEMAGVIYTLNPVNGTDEYIIESTEGLAELILDGSKAPERITFLKDESTIESRISLIYSWKFSGLIDEPPL